MSKGKKKRRNKRREMPPLTLLDKVLYWIAGATMLAALVGLGFVWFRWSERVAFADPEVVCSASHMSFLWVFPALFSLLITGLGFWCGGYSVRYPIFGIPGFLYGPPLPRIYPMFAKNRPPRKPADRRGARSVTALVMGVNLFFLALVPLSVAGRDSLMADGTVREFGMFGNVREEYGVRDTERVILSVYSYTSGKYARTRHRAVQLELVMTDGKHYEFRPGTFRRDDGTDRGWVRELERILEHYPAQSITLERAEELERAISDMGLDAEEAAILRRVFRLSGEG